MYIHNVPAVFYNYNPLTVKIKKLIDIGHKSIKSLNMFDKNELIALIMDALELDQAYVIFDTDEFSSNCDHFKNYIRSRSLNDLFSFTKSLEEAAFNKYSEIFSLLFNHFCFERSAA